MYIFFFVFFFEVLFSLALGSYSTLANGRWRELFETYVQFHFFFSCGLLSFQFFIDTNFIITQKLFLTSEKIMNFYQGRYFVRGLWDLKMPRTNSEKIDPKLYEIIFCPLFFGHYYWINQYTNSNIPTYSNYIDGYLWMRWCWLKSTRFDSVNHHMWYYVIIILM